MYKLLKRYLPVLLFLSLCNFSFAGCPENQSITISGASEPIGAGETVDVCYELNFITSQGCQWLQGVVPILGDCWDINSFDGSNATITSSPAAQGTWDWWNECDLEWDPNGNNPINTEWGTTLNTTNGTIQLCQINDPTIANCTLLTTGDCLPGGWYFTGNEGDTPGGFTPNETWGAGTSCNGATNFQFCFEIQTVDSDCDAIESCPISFKTFVDAEIGDWASGFVPCPTEVIASENFDFSCQDALPLQLIEFNGAVNDKTKSLWWTTENEYKFSHFELEYGFDGKEFNFLTTVQSRANDLGSVNSYAYEDKLNLNRGTTYYRLKMIDTDGTISYSNVVALTIEAAVQIQVHPVPAVDYITIQHPLAVGEEQLIVFNATGILIHSEPIGANAYSTTIQLDDFDTGIHFLQYTSNHKTQTHKFLITK